MDLLALLQSGNFTLKRLHDRARTDDCKILHVTLKALKALNPKWVVVKIMVSFWIPIIIRHLIFRVPQKGS